MQKSPLIIFVHGLTGSKDEIIYVYGEEFFQSKGYDTYRFNLYGTAPWEKKLSEVSLKDHVFDVSQTVSDFVEKGYEKIYLVGHSFWGLTILYSDLTYVSALVLRDSSIGGNELLTDTYQDENSLYIDWWDGIRYPISQEMYNDFMISPEEHKNQISKLNLPIKIITAEFWLPIVAKELFDSANEQKSFSLIKNASHTFLEEWVKEVLFEETFNFLNMLK